MTQKTARFPNVRTAPELKDRVMATCEYLNIKYSTVVTQLLRKWAMGNLELKFDSDADFAAAAKEALESNEIQSSLKDAVVHYKKLHKGNPIPNAIKI